MRALSLLSLLLVPLAANAQVFHANFEARGAALPAGWSRRHVPATGEMVLDSARAHLGRQSLRLRQTTPGEHVTAMAALPLPALGGAVALRLSGWVRTEDVRGGHAGFQLAVLAPQYAGLRQPPGYASWDTSSALLSVSGTTERGLSGTQEWRRMDVTIPVMAGATQLWVAARLDATGTAWFDDLEVRALRPGGFPRPSPEAVAYVDFALDTLQAHVLGREAVDWPRFRQRVMGALMGARTPAETYPALRMALASLNRHSLLMTPPEVAAMESDTSADAGAPVPSGAVLGRFGYLVVPAFMNVSNAAMSRYAEAAHAALSAQDSAGVCGYVVDLRPNTGGTMLPMLAATGPLLYERLDEDSLHYEAGNLRAHADRLFDIRVEKPAPVHLNAPVAVLIGPNTASSGEATLLRFMGRPNTRTFGQSTYGHTTGNEMYRMPDGAGLFVTTVVMQDRTGRRYGGPVLPDEPVEAAPADRPEGDPVVQRALAWLGRQPACIQ